MAEGCRVRRGSWRFPRLRSGFLAATVPRMRSTLSYRHRAITDDELVFIRKLIAEHPDLSRRSLSKKLCIEWNWVPG